MNECQVVLSVVYHILISDWRDNARQGFGIRPYLALRELYSAVLFNLSYYGAPLKMF